MAYAFDKINSAMEDDEFKKKPSYTSASQPEFVDQNAGSAPSPSMVPPAQKQMINKFTPQGASEAKFQAFKGKAEIPGFIGNLGGSIEQKRKDIEDSAKKYVDAQHQKSDTSYQLGDADFQKALEDENSAEYKRLYGNYRSKTPRIVDKPELPSERVFDEKDILTFPKIKDMFSKRRGANYGSGLAEFDTNLIKETPQFTKKIHQLIDQQKELSKYRKDQFDPKTKEAQDYENSKLEQTRNYIKDYLTNLDYQDTLAAQERANDFTQKYQDTLYGDTAARKQAEDLFKQQLKDYIYQQYPNKAVAKQTYDDWLKYNQNDDLQEVLKFNLPYETAAGDRIPAEGFSVSDFLSKVEADRLNRLNRLLGNDPKDDYKPGNYKNEPSLDRYFGYNSRDFDKIAKKYAKQKP